MRPFLRYAGLYAMVELAALALLIWAVGLAWTLLILAASFVVGVTLAASQLRGQFDAVRRAQDNPRGAVTDGVLVGLGALLVLIPGIVSTAAGAFMLAPSTRGAMRPLAATMLTRGVVRRIGVFNIGAFNPHPSYPHPSYPHTGPGAGRGDYIDGEVIGEVDQLPARR